MLNKLINSVFITLLFAKISFSQNVAPTLSATGDQPYCPHTEINIVTDFDIDDPDDTEIQALFIQISTGYIQWQDMLSLSGTHPNIKASWNTQEGKLTLTSSNGGNASYSDLIAATKAIVFSSTSDNPSDKAFSITIGDANYLPLTGHYYEYVDDYGITWTAAKTAAENRTYFGLQGYLATVLYEEEAQLVGEQAPGAGWLGGNDLDKEGEWKWVTGPEAGTVFWNGAVNGSTPNFAKWNYNEPNNVNGGEDFLHITDPSIGIPGAWNDLREIGEDPGPYYPKGYVVEYGGMPGDPEINISASTRIYTPRIDRVEDNVRCGIGSVELKAYAEAASSTVYWFESEDSVSPIFTGNVFETPTLSESTIYYVIASENNCLEGDRTPVDAIVYEEPSYNANVIFKNCDEDGIADGFTFFNLEESVDAIINDSSNNLNITFYKSYSDAEASLNAIQNTTNYNNNEGDVIYAKIVTANGCAVYSTVTLETSTTKFPEGYMYNFEVCDDDTIDGFYAFDLTEASEELIQQFPSNQNLSVHYFKTLNDAQLEQNEILPQTSYTNEISFSERLFVRVESEDNGNCYGLGEYLQLTVQPKPEFTIEQSDMLCLNDTAVELYVVNPSGNFTYQWQNESGDVVSTSNTHTTHDGGTFTVIATSHVGCESLPMRYTVNQSGMATITEDDITVVEASKNNSISINSENENLGVGDYEFALDDEMLYQDDSYFNNLSPGKHVLYVRDKNGCGMISLDVFILGFPKFFTPNNDGLNDTWQIEGLGEDFTSNSTISVYNRYGKLVKQINAQTGVWDGTFNGNYLPNSDYWFVANLIEKTSGNIRTYRGHFSLLR